MPAMLRRLCHNFQWLKCSFEPGRVPSPLPKQGVVRQSCSLVSGIERRRPILCALDVVYCKFEICLTSVYPPRDLTIHPLETRSRALRWCTANRLMTQIFWWRWRTRAVMLATGKVVHGRNAGRRKYLPLPHNSIWMLRRWDTAMDTWGTLEEIECWFRSSLKFLSLSSLPRTSHHHTTIDETDRLWGLFSMLTSKQYQKIHKNLITEEC